MFGLIKKSEHQRICRNLHSHIKYYAEISQNYSKEVSELKKNLVLENRRAMYWKMRFLDPDNEPLILGEQEDIEYIKG